MLPASLPLRAQRTRLVRVADDLDVTLELTPTDYFACDLRASGPRASDGSPRERSASVLHLQSHAPTLKAGSRVTFWNGHGLGEWELLADPSPVRAGGFTFGHAAPVEAVDVLYPLRGRIEAKGGESIADPIKLAIWRPSERDAERGNYADWLGEVPIDHREALEAANRRIVVGDLALNVRSAVADFDAPRLSLELTRG